MKEFKNLLEVVRHFSDEQTCIDFLVNARWNGKPVCPHCGNDNKIYFLKTVKKFKCSKCRKQFSVKIGTIFEDSALPLSTWFAGFYLITAHKKGISSMQLAKDLGITQKTAWFVLHRIRYAMKTESFNKPLEGTIECDETYVGGKNKNRHYNQKKDGKGTANKQPVFGLMERKGKVIAFPIQKTDGKTLIPIITENVSEGSTLMTDEHGAYFMLNHVYKHFVINHSSKIYVNGDIHTNSIENFWSMLKRGIIGIYHQVSSKHLHRYCDEFAYRFNSRDIKDVERFTYTFTRIASNGKLQYKTLIA